MIFSSEPIRSRQNRSVVALAKLTDRRERETRQCFRFDGIKLAEEAIGSGIKILQMFLRESRAKETIERLSERTGRAAGNLAEQMICLDDGIFDRISEEKSPEGVICVAKYIDKFQKNVTIYNDAVFSELAEERVILIESVRDPVNIGAIVRSAAALGVDRLIISADCADIYHPKTVRASMGTLFRQKIDRTDRLPDVIGQLRESGRRVFAATLDREALPLGAFQTQRGDCVVIGNEGHGLTEQTIAACGRSVYIPMSGKAESLNAAVAASLLIWEFAK